MFNSYFLTLFHFICVSILLRILAHVSPSRVIQFYSCVADVLLWVVIAYFTWPLVRRWLLTGQVDPKNKAVLITGCASGFGYQLAKHLDSKGYHVFASCRISSSDGAQKLRKSCSNRTHVFGLDVSKDDSVKEALQFVSDNLGTSELWAVVNNAGFHTGYFGELTPMEDYLKLTNVNAFGMVRVTKAFLPLIRRSKGRIVNVTSITGRTCFPAFTPYTMSKHAAVAFNDCLRREMEPWGVRVIEVEPEIFGTPIIEHSAIVKRYEDTVAALDDELKAEYGKEYLEAYQIVAETVSCISAKKIDKVIEALEHAICSKHPKIRYVAARNLFTRMSVFALECLPASLVDVYIVVQIFFLGFPKPKAA